MSSAVCPTCGQQYPARVKYCANDGTQLVAQLAQASASGQMLGGGFEVRERIGEGILGAVYRGWQHSVSRDVAIKMLRPAFAQDPPACERLFAAVQLACQLSRPSIVNTYDVGYSGEAIYVVMELVRGRSLAQDLAPGKPLPVLRSLSIAYRICDALVGAHRQHTWHGDLKPANVIVVGDAQSSDLKVVDFGLARAVMPDPWSVAPKAAQYLAPELADGAKPDARSDLYALGCILHEMLTGQPPFTGTTTRSVLDKHRLELPPRLPRAVPPPLAAIVSRLLAKKPEQRYDSATALRSALQPMRPATRTGGVPLAVDPGEGHSQPHAQSTGAHSQPPFLGPHTGAHSQPPITAMHTGAYSQPPSTGPFPSPIAGAEDRHARAAKRSTILVISIVTLLALGVGIGLYVLVTS